MIWPEKITFGQMRSSGVRCILVYCADYHCSHDERILFGHDEAYRPVDQVTDGLLLVQVAPGDLDRRNRSTFALVTRCAGRADTRAARLRVCDLEHTA
jgi:hypothetical protein